MGLEGWRSGLPASLARDHRRLDLHRDGPAALDRVQPAARPRTAVSPNVTGLEVLISLVAFTLDLRRARRRRVPARHEDRSQKGPTLPGRRAPSRDRARRRHRHDGLLGGSGHGSRLRSGSGSSRFLFVGYFVLDGFDFGVGMSLPFLGKDDIDRRLIINTIGPVWDLNETWVIVAGACLFAAFPEWYATLFSGFYLALLLILLALIAARGLVRVPPPARQSEVEERGFDAMIVVGSAVPALLWGVAFANIVQGVPLDADHEFTGSLLDLLNPYAPARRAHHAAPVLHARRVLRRAEDRGRAARARAAARRAVGAHHRSSSRPRSWSGPVFGVRHRSWFWILAAIAALALIGGWLANVRGARAGAFGSWPSPSRRPCSPCSRPVPRRDAVVERPGEQPHDRATPRAPTYTLTVMSWARARLPPAGAALPGLDVLGLPQAGHARRPSRRRRTDHVKPLDPRLVRRSRSARWFLIAGGALGGRPGRGDHRVRVGARGARRRAHRRHADAAGVAAPRAARRRGIRSGPRGLAVGPGRLGRARCA